MVYDSGFRVCLVGLLVPGIWLRVISLGFKELTTRAIGFVE